MASLIWSGILFVLMLANLGFYAWGSHDPANLAAGILLGFVFVIDQIKRR